MATPSSAFVIDMIYPAIGWRCTRLNRRVFLLLILAATLGGVGCQDQQANPDNEKEIARARYEASQAAYAFLESFAKPTPENVAAWGLTDFSIYGQPSVFNPAAGEERTPSLDGYRVVIPLWVMGKDSNGESVRLIRKLSLDVKRRGDSWTATNPQFLQDEPLSFTRVFWIYTLWTSIGVLLFVGMSLWICWIATGKPARQTSSSTSSSPSSSGSNSSSNVFSDFWGCLQLLLYGIWIISAFITWISDPSHRLWGICIILALVCWFLKAVTSIKLLGMLGVLSLGFPVIYAVKGLFDSTLLAIVLFVGTFLATAFVCAAVANYRNLRQPPSSRLSQREVAELLALLQKQKGQW